jgi:deoxyribose-phosphate aldolase
MKRLELAGRIDATAVHNNHTRADIDSLVENAKRHQFACVFMLPCYMEDAAGRLKGTGVHTGGVVGFPSGGEFTETKLFETRRSIELGAEELDMVINIGWLLSGAYAAVRDEIRAVKEIAGALPVKCIIEMALLREDDVRRACELIIEAGADYVKTGTGWFGGATPEGVRLLRSVAGDDLLVKAAGGIRDLQAAVSLLDAGADRLGIGLGSAVSILDAMEA